MEEYLQTFYSLLDASVHAEEFSKRENRPGLSDKDSADLYVIQSKDTFYVSSSSYAGIYDYVLARYSNGVREDL